MDFLRRNPVWVAVGAMLVLALVLYLVFVQPLAAENSQGRQDVTAVTQEVDGLASSPEIPNRSWVDAFKSYQENLRTQYQQALQVLESDAVDRYKLLPGILTSQCRTTIAEGREVQIPQPAAFQAKYRGAVAELESVLRRAGIQLEPGVIGLPPDLAGVTPDEKLIIPLQQRYWLLREVAESFENRVRIDRLELLEEEGAQLGVPGEMGFEGPRMFRTRFEGDLFGGAGGGGREGMGESVALTSFVQQAGVDLGITTEMQQLFYQQQRRVRLVATMDPRELTKLVQALLSMERLSLVRSVDCRRVWEPGEPVYRPLVRVDVRVLCFDRYRKFVPPEVTEQP